MAQLCAGQAGQGRVSGGFPWMASPESLAGLSSDTVLHTT